MELTVRLIMVGGLTEEARAPLRCTSGERDTLQHCEEGRDKDKHTLNRLKYNWLGDICNSDSDSWNRLQPLPQ